MSAIGERPPADAPYRGATRPIAERVDDLLGRMTLAEKVAQLTSIWLAVDPDSGEFAPSQMMFGFPPEGELRELMADGMGQMTRPLGSRPVDPGTGVRAINELQRQLVEDTRLGIPAICHEECLTGLMAEGATSFPTPLNFAATWDPDLIERVGDTIRRQMRMLGTHQGLAPVADVARDARWGRIEETEGEDPYLVGVMMSAYVRGLQGGATGSAGDGSLRHGVIATLKHFVAYSGSEGGRNFAPTHVGPRELADVFLVPFEMAICDAGCRSVMNSYQEIDGAAPAASRWLLTGILREQWGFEGFVVADYGAVSFLYAQHRVASDGTEAAALAVGAGLDVELPNPTDYPNGLPAAIDRGLIDEATIDVAVRRVLTHKFELGLFDDPFVDEGAIDLDTAEDRALAAEVARRSIVLLANDGTLPLDEPSVRSVAVIGPNADDAMALFGNYSFENHIVSTHFAGDAARVQVPTVLEALRSRLGEGRVTHERGCEVMAPVEEPATDPGIAAAVASAAAAEVAVVVVGDKAGHFRLGTVGEGTDTTDLALPGSQQALVDAVIATGTPTVVVLLNGRPFALPGLADRAAAIVEAWFPGQDGAGAVVDVLLGDVNPAGRTAVSFWPTAGVMPASYHHKHLAKGLPALPEYEPVFAFGHGLSYTSFEYSDLSIGPVDVACDDPDAVVEVACTVRNTGERDGDEVVQLYVTDVLATVARPVLELKGFRRLALAAGDAARVSFELPVDLLCFTALDGRRVVEPGTIDVKVGASSADLRLKGSFELVGSVREVPAGAGRRRYTTTSRVAPLESADRVRT
jgi:beta-glucosidase